MNQEVTATSGGPFPVGDRALPNLDGGLFAALGIFGQQIYLNPKERLVVVIHSTWPEPIYEKSLVETYALLGAMTGALSGAMRQGGGRYDDFVGLRLHLGAGNEN